MCGIAGMAFKKAPSEIGLEQDTIERLVDNLLLGIEHRGRNSTGIVSAKGRKTRMDKAPKDATDFIKTRRGLMLDPTMVLLHTRFATQGSPKVNANNHPVRYDSTYIVHNGHISNDDEIFRDEKMKRHAEVDSEAIAAMFSKFGLEKAHLAAQKLQGGFATAVINPRQFPNTIILAKGESSPCVVFENNVMIAWASELRALDEAFGAVFDMKPKYDSIRHLFAGDILMMQDGVTEMLKFEVNYKFYSRSEWSSGSRTAWSGTGTAYSASNSKWREAKCQTCGCERYWHGNADFSGVCGGVHGQAANTKACTCKTFVVREADKPKTITTGGTGPGFVSPLRVGSFQVHITGSGKRIVREIRPNASTVSYGVCDQCKTAYEIDGLLYIYEYGICSNCYKPEDGEMMPDSILAPEVVQLMIADIQEEDDDEMEIVEMFEEDLERQAMLQTIQNAREGKDDSSDGEGINAIILAVEDEIFGGVEDLSLFDEFREEGITRVAETLGAQETLVEWVLYETTDDDLIEEETAMLFDEFITQYALCLKEIVSDYFEQNDAENENVGYCGVKAWDA